MSEEVRKEASSARAAEAAYSSQGEAERKAASKTKGWLIAGASVAVLLSIAAWKSRFDDEDYLRS